MLLTIGMIVKNEAERLRECLTGIQPLLKKLSSELVIVDTGSTDNTVLIAREFTNKVFHAEWRNDFAWARNQAIEKSKGEWYMFLDADEVLEDVSEIIEFFNSGEYLKYNCASIQMRDYVKETDSFTRPYTEARLLKLAPDTRFTGAVHEIVNLKPPIYHLSATARHMGYNDSETKKKKNLRNWPLIKKAHENDPTNLHYIRYMVIGYKNAGEPAEAKKYIDMGMSIVRCGNAGAFFHIFYLFLADYLLNSEATQDLRECVKVAEDYLHHRKHPSVSSIDMLWYKSTALLKLGDCAGAIKACEECYNLNMLFLSKRLNIDEIMACAPAYAGEHGVVLFATRLAVLYSQSYDYDSAFDWLAKIPVPEAADIDVFLEMVSKSGEYNRIAELYSRINNDEASKKLGSVYQVVRHMHEGEVCYNKNDAQGLVEHLVAAADCNSRYTQVVSKRANLLLD